MICYEYWFIFSHRLKLTQAYYTDKHFLNKQYIFIDGRYYSVMHSSTVLYYGWLTVVWSVKAKFHYAILVADRSEAGHRQVRGWS